MIPLRSLLFLLMSSVLSAQDQMVIELWPEGVPDLRPDATPEREAEGRIYNVHQPSIAVHKAAQPNGTALIICPGGSYTRLAYQHEGVEIARWMNSLGVTAFVLKYRLAEYGHPAPLRDVLRAIRTVRSRAAEFGINPERIGIFGASAGGHLAGSAATLFDAPEGKTGAALDATSARPDFAILLYPVVAMRPPHAHPGSARALMGPTPSEELSHHLSVDLQVSSSTPPTYIVHAQADPAVPVHNAILLYEALCDAKVPAELHIAEKGPHGFGLREGLGSVSHWPRTCEAWMQSHGWISPEKN